MKERVNAHPETVLPAGAQYAIARRKKDVDRILENRMLCDQLRTYFRTKKPYANIVDALGGPRALGMKESLPPEEIGRVLRGVKQALVDALASDAHARHTHAVTAQKHTAAIAEGRREWMAQQGFFVWTPEQDAYFRQLIHDPAMRRPGPSRRLNHSKIAAALNEHFQTNAFMPAITSRHADNTDKQVQAARRARQRIRRNSNGNGNGEKMSAVALLHAIPDDLRQFHQAVAISPFIVVPSERFEQCDSV